MASVAQSCTRESSILLYTVVSGHSHSHAMLHCVNRPKFLCFAAHGHPGNSQVGIFGYSHSAVTSFPVHGMSVILSGAQGRGEAGS